MKQFAHFIAVSVRNLFNPGVSSHLISVFISMYERLNVTNVQRVSNPNMIYQVTATQFTATLEHLNVKNVEKVSNFNIIYHSTVYITLM
jgi:predicted Zn-dependent protease